MTRTSLALLSELAQGRQDLAGRKLGRSLALLKESEGRLVLLAQYREEYGRRYARAAQDGVAPDELRNFRGFLVRLDRAVEQQRAEVEVLKRGASQSRGSWLKARSEGKSLDVLADRADEAERATEALRLQKLLDEFSGRLAGLAP